MSKGKHQRKQRRAPEKAQQKRAHLDLSNGQTIGGEEKWNAANNAEQERNDEKKGVMGLRELIKRPSITDWLIVLFTFILSGASIYQFIVMKGQLSAMRDQLHDSDRQFSVSHRPWMNMAEAAAVVKPLTFDATGAHVQVVYSFKNGGNSPALHVSSTRGLIIATNRTMLDDIYKMLKEGCAFGDYRLKQLSTIGTLLVPGEPYSLDAPDAISTRPGDLDFLPTDQEVQAWIAISISYKDDADLLHCTASAQAYRTPDGSQVFKPNGVIQGQFTRTAIGYVY